jgi:regulator of protease activity HflC (stomatin/prohibitin superfamily)
LADSQRGSRRKEKADARVVKEEECASVSAREDGKMTSGARGIDLGGNMPAMPRLGGLASKFLRGLGLVLLVILLFASVVSVPTGHVGVLTLFGKVTGETLGEGIHLINPLKSVQRLSIQTQSVKESASVPSNEGLILALDTSLLFHLDRSKAAEVYQKVGANYAEKIVEPTLRAAIRAATSAHTANALYTNARELVQQQIQEELIAQLAPRGVIIENVLLRDVQLPTMLKSSIEAKQQAEQDALRMSFILQKEKQEAERKRIEAQGIADFQKIVAQGISPQLLEWKGIEATEKLATSSNSKVVVVGNTKNGLPLILGPQ